MTDHRYSITRTDDRQTVAFFTSKGTRVANGDHRNFSKILNALVAGEPEEDIVGLFDLRYAISRGFERLGRRVTVQNDMLYFDGDLVDGSLAQIILKAVEEGNKDLGRLVKFFEKLKANPNPQAVEHLYRWLAHLSFAINDEGNILAYKAVHRNSAVTGLFQSNATGHAWVDGVEFTNTEIPQKVGSVVEMPRSEVTFDPHDACSAGLHFGTWDFAKDFLYSNPTYLLIEVDPIDVVSVPSDERNQKARCCRYTVVEEITGARTSLFEPLPIPEPEPEVFENPDYEDEFEDVDPEDDNDEFFSDEAEYNAQDETDEILSDPDALSGIAEGEAELDDDPESAVENAYAARLSEVLALKRDGIRKLAKSRGIKRRDRTATQLAELIVKQEFTDAS